MPRQQKKLIKPEIKLTYALRKAHECIRVQ